MKWDGVRALATVRDGTVTLRSRNGNDLTAQYPELQELGRARRRRRRLRRRDRGARRPRPPRLPAAAEPHGPDEGARGRRRAAPTTPVRFLLFDVLEADGHELDAARRTTHRRQALETVVRPGGAIEVPPAFDGDLDAGARRLGASRASRASSRRSASSRYAEGRRSEAWLKLKHHATQEVVVAGWKPGQRAARRRASGRCCSASPGPTACATSARSAPGSATATSTRSPGARTAGAEDPAVRRRAHDRTRATRTGSRRSASARSSSPSGPADGRLRQPSWRGWRPDKAPDDVVAGDLTRAPPSGPHACAWGPPRANFRPPFGASAGDNIGAAGQIGHRLLRSRGRKGLRG